MEAQRAKPEKWTSEQIERLIDAYKEERCLYATDLKNYHNRVLRSKALERVAAAVRALRPSTNPRECFKKLHALRNSFSIENAKVKTALNEGGSGEDDMYEPSLWYYPKLLFLETYLQPKRKKRFPGETSQAQDSSQGASNPFVPPQENWKCEIDESISIEENSILEHMMESEEDDHQGHPPPLQADASPDRTITTFLSPVPVAHSTPAPPPPPQPTTSAAETHDRAQKRKPADFGCAEESTKHPRAWGGVENAERSGACSVDPVDAFMSFIGSLIRSFHDEELKLDVMNSISQTVFDAKSIDIKRRHN